MRTSEASKTGSRVKRIAGVLGGPSRSDLGEGRVGIATLDRGDVRTPRGQRGRHVRTEWERKPGTTRGSPRRSRTAKASRISRPAVKSRCAGEWGGWGRLSEDGPGQHNPDPSEGPWGGGRPTLHGGASSGRRPGAVRGNRSDPEVHEGRRQTGRQQAHAGSRLKPLTILGRPRLTGQPSSRTGENPPYGMSGGIEETSASFEARSAPRSYPTACGSSAGWLSRARSGWWAFGAKQPRPLVLRGHARRWPMGGSSKRAPSAGWWLWSAITSLADVLLGTPGLRVGG